MSIRFGFHRKGNCWSVRKAYRNRYYSGDMTVLGWWRMFVVLDRRGR